MRAWIIAALLGGCTDAVRTDPTPDAAVEDDVVLELTPIGPDPADVEAFATELDARPEITAWAAGHRFRQMRFELEAEDVAGALTLTTRFHAVFWDYDASRSFSVRGDMAAPEAALQIDPSVEKLAPTLDEVEEAKNIALQDPTLRAEVDAGRMELFRAMPPTIDHPDGHRVVALGIRPTGDTATGEIAGVDLTDGVVIHFDERRPPTSRVGGFVCNPPPYSPGSGPVRGTQGWAQLRAVQGGAELWKMTVRRPASSSGPNGSGVELMDVRYRTKKVLDRAHLPILNVEYTGAACGPYRDWQWQENPFMVGPTRVELASGIRVVDWAKTMLQTGSDQGNYSGVAIWWDAAHQQVVVISEIEAGWYRYATEFRFGLDGTINPRFGFDAVQNWCTCQEHMHHAYWRLDFAIGSGNNRFEQREGGGAWQLLSTETSAVRDDAAQRQWRVRDAASGDSYRITPVPGEDAVDDFGVADAWFLETRANETDDAGTTAAPFATAVGLDSYVNGGTLVDNNNLMWWGGHFLHNDALPTASQTHTVQILLTPESW